MKKVVLIKKKEGETPLEALGVFRFKHPSYENVPMTYAGRLDPMASGLLLVLVGEECKNKDKYLKLDKEYEFEVLFGFATDTYDILGKVTNSDILQNTRMSKQHMLNEIKRQLKFFLGKHNQVYPLYSSKTVAGKQLWQYARGGEDIEIPTKEIEIKFLQLIGLRSISSRVLLKSINKRISRVSGDFRQKEILELWQKKLAAKQSYSIAKFRVKCSSGTYVRSFANSLGDKIGIPALAYSIKRTRIGKYAKV